MKLTVLLSALVLAFGATNLAVAQQHPGPHSSGPRERWEHMPHDERAKFVERFEKFRTLPPEERAKLAERAERLEGLRDDLVEGLPPEVRERLEKLSPLERVDALREFMEQRLEARGRHVRGFLPRELRERIEGAPPEERERIVRDFCSHTRRDQGQRMLREMAERLELPTEEVARIEALPDDQRFDAMMGLRRRMIERDVAEDGVPTWLDAKEWSELGKLPTSEFFERFHSLRRDRCGSDHDHCPGGRGFGSRRAELPSPLRDALTPDPAWFDEAERLPEAERRAFLDEKLRERVLARLAEHPELLSPEALESLRAKQGTEFQSAVRDLARGKDRSRRSAPRDAR
ncbi:MAG: DUF3106 domain-containing protein [Planctomycetes bacterium]|nr:DUF3106 domain-containing protein [Planctomycetota bacterium]